MKKISKVSIQGLKRSMRWHLKPIQNLSPDGLVRILDAFHAGYLREAALLWDAIERRDDIIRSVSLKRKKSIARLPWTILTIDDSNEAREHKDALEQFYNRITVTHACDSNEQGGLSLLIKQMMDAVGKKYAVHEVIFESLNSNLTAMFKFIPLWFFENKTGSLRFLQKSENADGQALERGGWMTTVGDGLMEACSIAYLFKHLPLRDWLIYCERNGMPGVKGKTDALPNSSEWLAARDAVRDFGAEFHALMSVGTDIEAIDLTARGELPYPILVERMDRAMTALWRGSDLGTLARQASVGASIQAGERDVLEEDDAASISETLNIQIDRLVIKHIFGVEHGKAYFKLQPHSDASKEKDLGIYERLHKMGYPMSIEDISERFGVSLPSSDDRTLNVYNFQKRESPCPEEEFQGIGMREDA